MYAQMPLLEFAKLEMSIAAVAGFLECSIDSLLTRRPLQFLDSGFPAAGSQLMGFFVPYRRGVNMCLCAVEQDYARDATGAQVTTAVTHDQLLTNLTNWSFLIR